MVRKLIKWVLALTLIIVSVVFFSVNYMPLTKISELMSIQLHNPIGTLRRGSIDGFYVDGTRLNLACSLTGNIFSTEVRCDEPLQINGQIRLSFDGRMTLENVSAVGQLKDAKDWMRTLNLPPGLNGHLELQIDKVTVSQLYSKPLLNELDLDGNITTFSIMRLPLFSQASIQTKKSENPIELVIQARNEDENNTQLMLNSIINNNEYTTNGTLTGNNLAMMTGVLGYFGRPLSPTEWQISLTGKVF